MAMVDSAIITKFKDGPILPIVGAAGFCHFINDFLQALLLAVYPILRGEFHLSFVQVGLLTLCYQLVGSFCQPLIGNLTDKRPLPFSLPFGMASSGFGLLIIAFAPYYALLLVGCVFLGLGSSIFHPETSRIARLAAGKSPGMAQSIFQVGGNVGTSIGPLAAAYFILPQGQSGLAWFALVAVVGILIQTRLSLWYRHELKPKKVQAIRQQGLYALPPNQVRQTMAVLILLLFSKFIYTASFTSYYSFYLMDKFDLPTQEAQIWQFVFLASVAAGTICGGHFGDRFGRKLVIWVSILGILPFTLLLPYMGLYGTGILSVIIGFVLASAFPAIVVYGQELMPGRVGMVAGLFFGLIFGIGGVAAALLGMLADWQGIGFVFKLCSFLPALGIMTIFLPNLGVRKAT